MIVYFHNCGQAFQEKKMYIMVYDFNPLSLRALRPSVDSAHRQEAGTLPEVQTVPLGQTRLLITTGTPAIKAEALKEVPQ
jgi:hypothetical protein